MSTKYKLSDLGTPMCTSRSSEIFDLGNGKLLKLFFKEASPTFIKYEEENLKEAFSKGVSTIECFDSVDIDGRRGIVIKKIPGKTLIGVFSENTDYLPQISIHMANLQLKMHKLEAETMHNYRTVMELSVNSHEMDFLTDEEKIKAKKYVDSLPDGNKILHLDYHPDNIMAEGDDACIIDWATAACGAPAADVATTVYLMSEGEMVPGLTKEEAEQLEILRVKILEDYLEIYRKEIPITDEEIAKWRLAVLMVRLHIWNIDSEVLALQEKIRKEIAKI